MRIYRRRHRVPELNTTSTADISFMLLIFFLVTTNMDVDKGLTRQLPPAEKQEQEDTFVAQGTMMTLQITADNQLMVNGKPIAVNQLRQQAESFIKQVGKKHLFKLDAAPEARYDLYFQIQNELVAAYKNVRNETSQQLFHQNYETLSQSQRERVREECPQRIAEQYNGMSTVEANASKEGGAR
ncbi:MAG: ExbD/TolR family protein [Prevotella sp.]|jgi:biopolymer transport protein ExbD